MTVDCLIEDPRWEALDLETLAEAASDAALAELGLEPSVWEISLMGCDDARIATLNADFRGKPQATNVLSWPSEERGVAVAGEMPVAPDPADPELGDIAIAFETCEAEARAAAKPLAEHVTHLIVHATLHLLGYDHDRDADATLMEGLETQILGKMGLDDPYRT
ncbi:rRNA maturation RNase YbeY [Loktanella sp. M215]|uniref:rRNA maturation RNase YbeY n=1 Tax=Loktanella sp. M215 TaxID=2675431 RepID=UPI001F00EE8D|nr:rRNA maturation RNase YbeY [Loktanella sp. M215]MCF7699613.1 rRNA maturation RNase YbeY [Loktanella sp. M215]